MTYWKVTSTLWTTIWYQFWLKIFREHYYEVAKIATKNRQNRHMAEFRKTYELKIVEHLILCGKMVS